jgi:signal peptidase I
MEPMGRYRRRLGLAAAVCILAAGAVGCGSDGEKGGTQIESTAPPEPSTSSTPPAPAERIVETQTDSMVPTLIRGDRIAFRPILGPLSRGDIVAYYGHPPAKPDDAFSVHRVVGLPGEKVEAREGTVRVNDDPLAEPYLPAGTKIYDFPGAVLPPDSYWIMGDNRDHAADSRIYGPIPKSSIVAVAARIDQPAGRRRNLP